MLMSKEIYFDRIESYVEGTNPPEEKRQFEEDLEENSDLKKEYQAYLATQEALGDLALTEVRARVARIAQHPPQEAKKIQLNRSVLAVAAGFLMLIAALAFLYGRQQYSDQNLFAQQYESPNWSPIRGADIATEKYDQAVAAIQGGNRAKAMELLEGISSAEGVYANAQYTLGHLQLEGQQAGDAIQTFETLQDLKDKRYQENVEWFLALAHLQAGNETLTYRHLGVILQNQQHPYYTDALNLQSRLQSFWRRF